MCSPSLVWFAKRTLRAWPVSDGLGFFQDAQKVGRLARALAIAAAISASSLGTLITVERSSTKARTQGLARRRPTTRASAMSTINLKRGGKANVIFNSLERHATRARFL